MKTNFRVMPEARKTEPVQSDAVSSRKVMPVRNIRSPASKNIASIPGLYALALSVIIRKIILLMIPAAISMFPHNGLFPSIFKIKPVAIKIKPVISGILIFMRQN